MLTPEDIKQQFKLLALHRRTLEIYVYQRAKYDESLVPAHIIHGIEDNRESVFRIKRILATADIMVDSIPGIDYDE